MRLNDRDFQNLIEPYAARILDEPRLAVAVSGGGDSLALLYLLSRWAKAQSQTLGAGRGSRAVKGPSDQVRRSAIEIHALTVDHGLRPGSKLEAAQVAAWVKDWPCVTHKILTWTGVKPKTRISETARAKRYDLLHKYCKKNHIDRLMLAHQMEDQAETFLLRLAAGSGLDGLACMRPETMYKDIVLWRPLLGVSHDQLIGTLRAAKQTWVEDPTNGNPAYARPRLRAVRDALAAEGFTPARLAKTAARVLRGVERLEHDALYAWRDLVVASPRHLMISRIPFQMMDDDMRVRLLNRMIAEVGRVKNPARLEQIETLDVDLATFQSKPIRRTLAGCIITLNKGHLKVVPEKVAR